MGEIGTASLICPRCGASRLVRMTAEIRTANNPATFAVRCMENGQAVGQVHLLIRSYPEDHECSMPAQPRRPQLTLVAVSSQVEKKEGETE